MRSRAARNGAIPETGFNAPASSTRKARGGTFAGRAMNACIGSLATPSLKMRLERIPCCKRPPGDRVLFYIADAVLRLAFRASPIWSAGSWPEAPMLGESRQLRVEGNLARHSVMPVNERPGVVEKHLLRHAPKLRKRAFQPVEPALLALVMKGANMDPARVAERSDEQKRLDLHAAAPGGCDMLR